MNVAWKRIMRTTVSLLVGLAVIGSGCIDITTRLHPEDPKVSETLIGSDCVLIVFGIGIGTADGSLAQEQGHPPSQARYTSPTRITKVRRVQWTDRQFLPIFGERCVEVAGE